MLYFLGQIFYDITKYFLNVSCFNNLNKQLINNLHLLIAFVSSSVLYK